jgi:hypothetical protein
MKEITNTRRAFKVKSPRDGRNEDEEYKAGVNRSD